MAAGAVKCVIGVFGLRARLQKSVLRSGTIYKSCSAWALHLGSREGMFARFFCVYFGPDRFAFSLVRVFSRCLFLSSGCALRVRASQGAGALFAFSPTRINAIYGVHTLLCIISILSTKIFVIPTFFSCDTPGAICVIIRWRCIFMQWAGL